ncbi:MAG: hypothetical protein DWQ47_15200 [Acidobacteria bacterium]|nr:MAG: hypothetical protein DWQ32_02600 [Acidobacteriota bacterium]REK02590.1 MAG: hypothetical protein DWQ38_09535 [Acidobacteriota bacterium]REK13607.1 MAG: hypothetical protein DWQ43_08290 [Acidobacteriota bacterium]REK41601.1 MAG: hypothetical protein DWQ47_15200 [Acidobacteriota bacterium]
MLSARTILKTLSIAVLIIGLAALAFADTVRLKDGSILKGKIISFNNGKFVMIIGLGERQREMTFFADEIESIVFDSEDFQTTSMPTVGSSSGGSEGGRPWTETTNGNETIITIGSARRDDPPADTFPTADSDDDVDPNAVAIDPNAGNDGSGPPILIDNTDDDDPIVVDDDDPIVIDDSDDVPTMTNDVPENDAPVTDPTRPQPVQIKVEVLADDTANGWTNAGWVVKKGQKIRIISNGRISLGNGRTSGPRGIATLPDANKLLKDRPTGSLIAVIGDDNNDFIFIGENREFTAERDGALFLGINEGNISDNSGSFDVIVEIEAGSN